MVLAGRQAVGLRMCPLLPTMGIMAKGDTSSDLDEVEGNSLNKPSQREAITLLAISFAIGISIGWYQPKPLVWPWLALAVIGIVLIGFLYRKRRTWTTVLLCVVAISIGSAWVTLHQEFVSPGNLAAWTTNDPVLVNVKGIALTQPVIRSHSSGSMGLFDFNEPVTHFSMRVDEIVNSAGIATSVNSKLYVRVSQTTGPFAVGDQVDVTGWLRGFGEPMNPGEFDFRQYAKSLGQAGLLVVDSRELLKITSRKQNELISMFLNWRDEMRSRTNGWLLSNLPRTDRTKRDALLTALLLGERGPDLEGLDISFKRVGLAHLLAISGFHLGVLAGFVLLVARIGGRIRRWHGWLVILVVLFYMLIVEVRMPVLRAGVMTMFGSFALVAGRRLRVRGLIALSGIFLLAWRPDQLFTAGFQLSYAVVLGLIHLQPILRERWFGSSKHLEVSASQMLSKWLIAAFTTAMTAWLIATPILIYHFGVISPLCVPLTIVALPLVSILLALGYVKIVLAIILPSASLLVGVGLSLTSDFLISIVQTIDTLPGVIIHVPFVHAAWSIIAIVLICWWVMRVTRPERITQYCIGGVLCIWLLWPMLPVRSTPALRIDMLSVGDGSCYVMRSGGKTVVFDAGSNGNFSAGERMIIPAMRHLGVRDVDVIFISHPNLDHYSAVLEIVDEYDVASVFVTPQFINRAEDDPYGPVAYLLAELANRLVSVSLISHGSTLTFGSSSWTWLNPISNESYKKVNDGSMVIKVQAAGKNLLLCGDIQQRTMKDLMQDSTDIAADILELPHHGSYHDIAEGFVRAVNPDFVLQSTGWSRWGNDRWASSFAADTERFVTARDGACWLEIAKDGSISRGRFRNP